MKTTQMARMDIPAKLVAQKKPALEIIDVSLSGDIGTSDQLRWNALNYAGLGFMASSIALNMLTGLEGLFLTLAIISGSLTGISILVNSILFMCIGHHSMRKIQGQMLNVAKPIEFNEFEKQTYMTNNQVSYLAKGGLRIKQKSTRTFLPHFFLPFRIFRKQLLSETTWYNPVHDIYLKKSIYVKANNLVRKTETYYGSRYEFKKAIDAI